MSDEPVPCVLRLGHEAGERPDFPSVTIDVVGAPGALHPDGWRGFDPAVVLCDDSPLLPASTPRRVGLWRCSCGEPGCGTIAALVQLSPTGDRVLWTDLRELVGICDGRTLLLPEIGSDSGRPRDVPSCSFDVEEYVAEVRRAVADRSWETPRRRIARLLADRLAGTQTPAGRPLEAVYPHHESGFAVSYLQRDAAVSPAGQTVLVLTTDRSDPEAAAEDLAQQLLSTPVGQRVERFGWFHTDWPDPTRAC